MNIDKLNKIKESKQVVDMYVEDIDNVYSMIGHIGKDIKAILPREESSSIVEENGLVNTKHIVNKKGKKFPVCIKEVVESNNTITVIVSKKILELKVRKWMYSNLKKGTKLKGRIVSLTEFLAFVDVGGGVTGVCNLSNTTDVPVNEISDVLKVGQRLNVEVVSFDKDTGKIELSCKKHFGTFKQKVKSLKEGQMVEGIVRKKVKIGVFIELKNNLPALSDHVNGLEYGQKVLVAIKRINKETEKVKVVIIG